MSKLPTTLPCPAGSGDEQRTYPAWVTDHSAACYEIGSLAWLLAQRACSG